MTVNPEHMELLEEVRQSLPDGFKAEISGDLIVMQASPTMIHQRNLVILRRQFDAHLPSGYMDTANTDLGSAHADTVRNPDLTYLPDQVMASPGHIAPAHEALIAVEIVSPSNPDNDWVGKVRDYPLMGVPMYLIVDGRKKSVTLFSELSNGRYRLREDAGFGEDVHIPAPFSFTLDTSTLMPY
jgi:Uma2 family endonuclease